MPKTAKIPDESEQKKAAKPGAKEPKKGNDVVPYNQETFLYFVGEQQKLDGKIDVLKAQRKKLRQRAKNAGIAVGLMDTVLNEEDEEDEAIEAREREMQRMRQFLNLPIGFQVNFLDEWEKATPKNDDEIVAGAGTAGYIAGLRGKSLSDNPHGPETPQGQEWMKRFNEGMSELKARIKKNTGT